MDENELEKLKKQINFLQKEINRYIHFHTPEVGTVYQIIVPEDQEYVYLTLVGGGGSGGLGYIHDIYSITGGGGGAGASIDYLPIKVQAGDQITIRAGRGGNEALNLSAEDSTVEVWRSGNRIVEVTAGAGGNGRPSYSEISQFIQTGTVDLEVDVQGGTGGLNPIHDAFDGSKGQDGSINLVSQPLTVQPKGGSNHYASSQSTALLGAGGLGGLPQSVTSLDQLSTNSGGDGFIIVRFYP